MTAFEGVRVLDLTTGVAGPLATTFFADFGADVLKVEVGGPDPSRATASFVRWNRGKRGAAASRDVEADVERVRELASSADVVAIRSTGDLPSWGIDVEQLLAEGSSPVILELPAWQGEAPWAGGHESQGLLSAASGYSRRQSSYDGGPVDIVFPHLLYIQAVMAATAATAALIERMRSGHGQVVTVDGMHAVSEAFTGNYTLDPDLPIPNSAVGPGGANPTYTHYQGSDGKWFLLAGLTGKFQERILHAIDEPWIIDDPRVAGDFSSLYSEANRGWVREVITARLATRTREDWLRVLRDAGVPCAAMNEPAEAFAHEQSHTIGIRRQVKDVTYGDVTIVGQPIDAPVTPSTVTEGAPAYGAEISTAGWLPRSTPTAGIRDGWKGDVGGEGTTGPLAGVRVLLLGSFVAGPYGAFLLGHLGADVVKIEAPGGDPWRERGFYYSDGMRSIALDLKNSEAHEIYLKLAADADLIVDNLRPGAARALKVGYDDVLGVNPDVVTVSLTGFGQKGPLAKEPGFDPVLQAWSGMCVTQGGDDTPVLYTVPVNDVSGAALVAFGACLGLFHRLRTGKGQAVSTSLAAAGMFMQCGQLVEGAEPSPEVRGGRDFLGPSSLDRYYRTRDGWIRLQAVGTTTEADVLEALTADPAASLEVTFAETATDDATSRLHASGIPAVKARFARDVVMSGEHPGRFELRRPAADISYYRPKKYAEFSRTGHDHDMRPPGAGEHTLKILAELGISPDHTAALIEHGAVEAGGPMLPRVLNPYR